MSPQLLTEGVAYCCTSVCRGWSWKFTLAWTNTCAGSMTTTMMQSRLRWKRRCAVPSPLPACTAKSRRTTIVLLCCMMHEVFHTNASHSAVARAAFELARRYGALAHAFVPCCARSGAALVAHLTLAARHWLRRSAEPARVVAGRRSCRTSQGGSSPARRRCGARRPTCGCSSRGASPG